MNITVSNGARKVNMNPRAFRKERLLPTLRMGMNWEKATMRK